MIENLDCRLLTNDPDQVLKNIYWLIYFFNFVVFVHMDVDVVLCFVPFCFLCSGGCVYVCTSALLGCIYLFQCCLYLDNVSALMWMN